MKLPVWLKPGLWCAAGGAVAMMIAGFWGMGWTTAGSAEKMARSRADTAVIAALVPFCIAKAQGDGDAAKLTKFRATTSSYDRNELVKANGWAAVAGASPDYQLIQACSDRLHVAAG